MGIDRFQLCFSSLRSQAKVGLVPFVTAGDPHPGVCVRLLHALVEAGADIVELGVPFSDPMADGPVIQAASERALLHGVSLSSVLDLVQEFREKDDVTPVVLMGYLNPVEVMGYAVFAKRAAEAGVDGVLSVDLPPEEAAAYVAALKAEDVAPIFLVAPTTSVARLKKLAAVAEGFVYYVSLKGVTGAASLDIEDVKKHVAVVRQYVDLPVAVGFGIRNAVSARAVAEVADAVVVGSALVERLAGVRSDDELVACARAFVGELRVGIDS